MDDLQEQVEKLRYHVKSLAALLDNEVHPIESLVVSMDWSEKDLEDAQAIFEKHAETLEQHGRIDAGRLEVDLTERFSIHYQTVKQIILAFWRSSDFVDVCRAFAEYYTCSEFGPILRGNRELDVS